MKTLDRVLRLTGITLTALIGLLFVAGTSFAGPFIVGHSGGSIIPTFDFVTGTTIAQFVTGASDSRGRGVEVVRGLACWNPNTTVVYYTSISGDIHVAPYAAGLGGLDIAVLPNPRQVALQDGNGIQDLDYVNGVLYAMTGYNQGNGAVPIVYALNPCTGAILSSVTLMSSSRNSDGFTVLPTGDFLINDGDASPTYRAYSSITGFPTGLVITLFANLATGVDYNPSDNSLYFFAQFGGTRTIVRTDLSGNPLGTAVPVDWTGDSIEDISVVPVDDTCPENTCAAQNHFKCYSVKGPNLKSQTVTLEDQFGDVTTSVREPKLLCNPVDKNGEGIPNPSAHLVCYAIKDKIKAPNVLVTNQFGAAELDVKESQLLCVPSTKSECPANDIIDISTGQTDASGDSLWQLTLAPPGTLGGFPHPAIPLSVPPPPTPGTWPIFSGTSWVSANSSCNTSSANCPAGLYFYELCWQQCGPAKVKLQLHADNNAKVFFNGNQIGATPTPDGFHPTTSIGVPDPGTSERNCLRIDVNNTGGPTGMDVTGSLIGAVQIVP